MSRLLVIEVLSGSVVGVSFDTGEPLDVSVAVVDHNDKRVYRNGEAEDGGGEEILALSKGEGYTDEDDEAENEPEGCRSCGNVDHKCACFGGVGQQTPVEVIK
jgi:hypothetical protein